jgi:hypothetical protein
MGRTGVWQPEGVKLTVPRGEVRERGGRSLRPPDSPAQRLSSLMQINARCRGVRYSRTWQQWNTSPAHMLP